tara:strand:+ start:150 stop:299 length:150 start_codon:yes stop_codon:yes gene_type:complete
MITHELAQIWITSDGKRFLKKEQAEKHEKKYQKELKDIEALEEMFKQFP